MGNNNYARGAAFEREVKAYLESLGWFAGRSAGSHGLVDVFAIDNHTTVWFIQCKTGKARMSKADQEALVALAFQYGAYPVEVNPSNYKETFSGR